MNTSEIMLSAKANESMDGPRELSAEELRFSTEIACKFASTGELSGTKDFVGQERALASLELGLGVAGSGYNIFVSGLTGAEKLETLRRWVSERAAGAPTPGDWIYVHNFKHPDAPRAIYLKAGAGVELRDMMHNLVKTLREELPKAFRQEAFDKEKSSLMEKFNSRAQELNAQFATLAHERGFQVQQSSRGHIYFIPVVDGKPLQKPADFAALPEEERREVEKRQQELNIELERLARRQQEIMREMEEDIRLVERRFGESLLLPILGRIAEALNHDEVNIYLEEVREHVLTNLDDFKETPAATMALPFMPGPRERDPYLEYEVNVVVDNAKTAGAPIVVESAPTYLNLVRHHRARGRPLRPGCDQFHPDQIRLVPARPRRLPDLQLGRRDHRTGGVESLETDAAQRPHRNGNLRTVRAVFRFRFKTGTGQGQHQSDRRRQRLSLSPALHLGR